MTTHTKAELCALVAEAMGLEPELDGYLDNMRHREKCVHGIDLENPCSVCCFNPIDSWEDFGRFWEWLVESGSDVVVASRWHTKQGGYQSSLAVREKGLFTAADRDNPRRALVLAFLKATGRID